MIYMDNAATTFPKPDAVYEKIMKAMKEYGANPGRSGHRMALEASRDIFHTRELISKLFNIENPLDIALTFNCSIALNYAIGGFLHSGDHIISTTMEHNSVLRPLNEIRKKGVKVSIVKADENGLIDPLDIEREINPDTKLIEMTHISNLTGTIEPIERVGEIARRNNIIFLVDAAQSAGVYDIDVKKMNIDLLAFSGHKSLFGPQGTGGLYVNEEIELYPIICGGTGSFSHSVEQPILMPDHLESGTLNAPGLSGLGEGIRFIMKEGMEKIRKHEEDITFLFLELLKDSDKIIVYGTKTKGTQAPVVALNIKGKDSSEVSEILDEKYDIAVRPGLHCAPLAHSTIGTDREGALRFSFGYFNTEEEVRKAAYALLNIAEGE